jgi:hypothetical protein
MGSKGIVTVKFGSLINKIWKDNEDRIYPAKIVKVLSSHSPHLVSGM